MRIALAVAPAAQMTVIIPVVKEKGSMLNREEAIDLGTAIFCETELLVYE